LRALGSSIARPVTGRNRHSNFVGLREDKILEVWSRSKVARPE
jgi:hypothetical protein